MQKSEVFDKPREEKVEMEWIIGGNMHSHTHLMKIFNMRI